RSASVALVSRAGTIETLWPGYSADMLNDLGRRLARLTGVEPKPLDTRDAPIKLAAGCRF
ncbi:peroxiredoxin family protein, partial [Singulisphaera rosea]